MSLSIVPWLVSLFFILTLILITRLKSVIRSISQPSYKNLTAGLLLLAIFSLVKVYHELGTMDSIPFLSEATFFQIIYSIGMISGAIFVLGAIAEFLPLSRKHREFDNNRMNRIELIKQVEQLVGVENRLDHLMKSTLNHIIESFDLNYGAVYKYSSRNNITKLVSTSSDLPAKHDEFKNICFDPTNWNGYHSPVDLTSSVISNLPDNIERSHLFAPILADNSPVGFFLLWGDKSDELNREDHQTLKIVTDIISRKIISTRNQLRYSFITKGEALGQSLKSQSKPESDLKENLHISASLISNDLDFEMLSLTILDGPGGSLRRLTVGSNGAVLDERGLAPSERRAISSSVCNTGQPFIVNDYDPNNALIGEDILDTGTMSSALCVPVTDDHKIVAILMIATEEANMYHQKDAVMLSYSTPAIAQMIRDEHYHKTIIRRENRISRIAQFVNMTQEADGFQTIAQAAAVLIADELATCQVRVSLVEDRGLFLKSCGLAAKRDYKASVPVDGQMILSLMPCHTLALDSGRRLIVNQSNAESPSMPDSESSQALNRSLNSALIVPIKQRETVIGMISVAEMRNWQRFQFDQSDIIFTEAMAEILALTHSLSKEDLYQLPKDESRISASIINDQVTRSRVRSSLTGILGSVELLNGDAGSNPESLKRCLTIIDSSARKINEYLTEPQV